MKSLIVACGKNDSLGNIRTPETRGLFRIGDKEVVKHTVNKFKESGVSGRTLILVNPEDKEKYDKSFKNSRDLVAIKAYSCNSDVIMSYIYGIAELGIDSDIIIAHDDIFFTFSLDGLIRRSREVKGNVMAVRHINCIDPDYKQKNYNFGFCRFGIDGKVEDVRLSFDPNKKIESEYVSIDLLLVRKEILAELNNTGKDAGALELIEKYKSSFYAYVINEGFWADIGKLELNKKARELFK
jgi:NDP-sugar pyrophosphorylase family protein